MCKYFCAPLISNTNVAFQRGNPVYYFFHELHDRPNRTNLSTDRHFQCYHALPDSEARIYTITARMNRNARGIYLHFYLLIFLTSFLHIALESHLRDFSKINLLYQRLWKQKQMPTVLQLKAARGDKSPVVLQYLQSLQDDADSNIDSSAKVLNTSLLWIFFLNFLKSF